MGQFPKIAPHPSGTPHMEWYCGPRPLFAVL
jgi:hypothetical protein